MFSHLTLNTICNNSKVSKVFFKNFFKVIPYKKNGPLNLRLILQQF